MDTRQVLGRFEAERQALALMDHPNIARILDGGATDTGRPYFVMDLVKGLLITQFCDEANLSTNDGSRPGNHLPSQSRRSRELQFAVLATTRRSAARFSSALKMARTGISNP